MADKEVGMTFFEDFCREIIYSKLQGYFRLKTEGKIGKTVGIREIMTQNTRF
ncbi:hypothetical protein BRDCF_p1670 [Bacteroidales bacterium CF]|jgi:hypothetical protein|nr:hypothetical protein BRDCF_p1670 [Bacteroidales bacterium CF]